MAPKNTKNAQGHDDVSGLFARLGTQASEGYHDFAYTQLPPRKPGMTPAEAPATGQAAPAAREAVVAPGHVPAAPSVAAVAPGAPLADRPSPEMHVAAPTDRTANGSPGDALAPLRKLRQRDEPGVRASPPPERPAQTPLEQLFQRLLQADARSSAHSPLQRLRSR